MLPSIGMGEIAVIAGVVAILFGAKRIPEVARNLGRSLSEFKRGLKDKDRDGDEDGKDKIGEDGGKFSSTENKKE